MGLEFFLFATLFGAVLGSPVLYYQPEQVHIAFGDSVQQIVVTWSTFNATNQSLVEYGIGGLILRASGDSTYFVDGGSQKHAQYIHKVVLDELTSESTYCKCLFVDLG